MNKKLAKITSAKLEIKERGILNFWIFVDYEDFGSQGIGGIALDEWSEDKKIRIGTAYGCEIIRRLLETLNVNDFSEMKDLMIWVHGTGDGLGFNPKGIEPLKVSGLNKEALIFDDVYNEFVTPAVKQ